MLIIQLVVRIYRRLLSYWSKCKGWLKGKIRLNKNKSNNEYMIMMYIIWYNVMWFVKIIVYEYLLCNYNWL